MSEQNVTTAAFQKNIQDALALAQRGNFAEAEAILNRLRQNQPHHFDVLHLLGMIALQTGRTLQGVDLIAQALAVKSNVAFAQMNLGTGLQSLGRLDEALACYAKAIQLKPDYQDAYVNQGNVLQDLKRFDDALRSYDKALAFKPDAETYVNRGNALNKLARSDEALKSYDRAIALNPMLAEAFYNRGIALYDAGRLEEAVASYDKAITLKADHAEAYNNRGNALRDLQRFEDALKSYDKAIALKPDHAESHNNRGGALQELGRPEQAIAAFERALTIKPDYVEAASNKIFCLDFIAGLGFAEHQAARRHFHEAHARILSEKIAAHANTPDPLRRLVIGYVSSDFRVHAAAFGFGPVLRQRDRARFRVVCYSGVTREDAWTHEFKAVSDLWRSTVGLSDDELASQIKADGIDILIDLSGHSAGNRLLAFARKPAPVQITAWGHAGGTGLPSIDYFFADPVLVPKSARPMFAEAIYDLPSMIGYQAPEYAPPVNELPARRRGYVTFGCLNRFNRVTDETLGAWARILHEVPNSRLLLKNQMLDNPDRRAEVHAALTALDIGAARFELRGGTDDHAEHLAAYSEIDIALDPFLYSGGITTWEALWMGVPVVTKLGGNPVSRRSGAILSALNLADWVAQNDDDYVALARTKSGRLDELAHLRVSLRDQIRASPAGDPFAYVKTVEDAYVDIWRRWCAAHPG